MNGLKIKTLYRLLFTGLLMTALAGTALGEISLEYLDSSQWTGNQDCVVRGDTLFTTMKYGVQAWDVSTTGAPELIGRYYTDGLQAFSIDKLEELLAVTTHGGTLLLLDATDLDNITLHSETAGIGTTPDVALRRDGDTMWAYTAGNTTFGLQVHDVSAPASPELIGSLQQSGLTSVTAIGDTLLTLGIGNGLHTVDISNPADPYEINLDLIPGQGFNVIAHGDLAVTAMHAGGFSVLDISNLADPLLVATVLPTVNEDYIDLTVLEVMLDDDTLYVITNTAGPLVYDLSAPAAPLLIGYDPALDNGTSGPYGEFMDGCLIDDQLHIAHWSSTMPGVLNFDVSTSTPVYQGRTDSYDFNRFVASEDGLVYTCAGEMGVYCLSNESGQGLELKGNLLMVEAWGIDVVGRTAHIASTSNGLVIADFTDPETPVVLSQVPLGQARGVVVQSEIAYVAAFTQGLHTVDVSDPENPELLDTAIVAGQQSLKLSVSGDLAATADRLGGMNLWNISDPNDIIHLATYSTGGHKANDVEIYGDTVYLTVEFEGTHIIDISDPELPVQIGGFADNGYGLSLFDNTLIVSLGVLGISIYDLTDPVNPDSIITYDTTDQSLDACFDDGIIYVADYAAVLALNYNYGTGVAHGGVMAAAYQMSNYPNPFNPRTDLSFVIPAAGSYSLQVYDVSGRLQRVLEQGSFDAGLKVISWNGTDDAGNSLPSGVYFARLSGADGSSAVSRMVLVR
jgi:hypothetical protein